LCVYQYIIFIDPRFRLPPNEKALPQPPRPDELHPQMYPMRMSSRPEMGHYAPANYPPQLGPRQNVRYSFNHGPPEGAATNYHRRPRSPSEFRPNSPPFHRSGEGGHYIHVNESAAARYYAQAPPPPRGYYARPGYKREEMDDRPSASAPPKEHFTHQEYRSMALEQSPKHSGGYAPNKRGPGGEMAARASPDDPDFGQEMRKREEEYGGRSRERSPYRMTSTSHKDSPAEFIQPRESRGSGDVSPPSSYRGDDRERMRSAYNIAPPRVDEDHLALFRGKPSISYGDYGVAASRSEASMSIQEYRTESVSYKRSGSSEEPSDFVNSEEKEATLIEPRSISPVDEEGGGTITTKTAATEGRENVYVDEQEIPIVTPSDDHMLTTSSES